MGWVRASDGGSSRPTTGSSCCRSSSGPSRRHPIFIRNYEAQYLKGLDADFFWSLRMPLSKRLYRLIDLQRASGLSWRTDLFAVRDQIPLDYTYPSQIKRALGITKEEIERRKPWQNFIETTFNIQRRMADYYFARAESWEELVAAHDGWMERYNTQTHWAHRERKDARRSPAEVLGFLTGVRHRPEDLQRAFFSTRFTRTLDVSGYARLKHWRVYGEEGLARREVALWLGAESFAVEFAGDTHARYDIEYSARTNQLREVKRPRLFETVHRRSLAQPRLFELIVLGEGGWLKALRQKEYAPRKLRRPQALQQALFAYTEAV